MCVIHILTCIFFIIYLNRLHFLFEKKNVQLICEICSRHCSNRRYASIKRIRSEVIRIKSAKVFLKAVHVIKGVIKGCKNLVFYTKYVIKKISLKILNIQNKHDIGWKIRSNYSNVHLIYAKRTKVVKSKSTSTLL